MMQARRCWVLLVVLVALPAGVLGFSASSALLGLRRPAAVAVDLRQTPPPGCRGGGRRGRGSGREAGRGGSGDDRRGGGGRRGGGRRGGGRSRSLCRAGAGLERISSTQGRGAGERAGGRQCARRGARGRHG